MSPPGPPDSKVQTTDGSSGQRPGRRARSAREGGSWRSTVSVTALPEPAGQTGEDDKVEEEEEAAPSSEEEEEPTAALTTTKPASLSSSSSRCVTSSNDETAAGTTRACAPGWSNALEPKWSEPPPFSSAVTAAEAEAVAGRRGG